VAIQSDLAAMIDSLDAGDVSGVLQRGQAGTRALPGKHGLTATSYAHVVVEIPDAPGALAALFRDIEAAGVNVEDLSINHDLEREVGWLSVQVAPEKAEALALAMTVAGWTVRDGEPQL
jgi:prephenate dehydrogenase